MTEEMLGLSLRLEKNTIEAVDETCAVLGIKRSEFIRIAVDLLLEELKPSNLVVRRIKIPKKVYERLLFLIDKGEIVNPEQTIEQIIIDGTNELFHKLRDEEPLIPNLDQRLARMDGGIK